MKQKEFDARVKEADTVISNLINEKEIVTRLPRQEKTKFIKFTYETEEGVKQRHAYTSLQRAREFLNEVEQIIER